MTFKLIEQEGQWVLIDSTQPRDKGLTIDFLSGAVDHRRRQGGGTRQDLARAVGIKPGYRPTIIDATAGLGRDAFVLVCLSCSVHMIERSPLLGKLLEQALQRASQDPAVGPIVRQYLTLTVAPAQEVLIKLSSNEYPDVIYLDPMFPERTKSALVKKEMRYLKKLVDEDHDAAELLKLSLNMACRRVVVKRPIHGPFLDDREPDFQIKGKKNRYDVYRSLKKI